MGTNRITGMYSGLDTESLINSLMEAKRTKVTKKTKEQSRIKYQQDAWTDLNKKLKSLYSKVDNLKFHSSYSKKTTSVSNDKAASVISSDSAMNTTQTLKIKKLAKSGYTTGGEIKTEDGTKATAATLLKDIDGIKIGSKISINSNGKSEEIEITEDMTISELNNKLAEVGVKANFDSSTQRFFIGSSVSGEAGDFSFAGDAATLDALGLGSKAKHINGSDAEIELNGVTYTSNENTFSVNGLTITAMQETGDEEITLKTATDTSAIYDMIKDVVNEYSSLINEMDKLYNADTKTKYEPLTDEEKSAMSDFEIEKWEKGLKDQVLAKDSNLRNIATLLKADFQQGFKVNGKMMHIYDIGIETASYFTAAENEKAALHIKGDKDDSLYASETNKLQQLITEDPEAVTDFFTQLMDKVATTMSNLSSRVTNTRTYGTFYDDQKMKADYTDYTTKLADMESKLAEYEDKWYKKFSKMETAMAKMQSNQNALSGMFTK